ncbi:MAG: hypothetical protein DRP94_07695 [Candidatus Latescibacterota bacterium]|nr:MAG: hypothetical protein DRP94_07695 [Candidatus Latescibacterota bacterium]RKY74664.1 MAG: hypothetical protein DRQ14_01240 [Candidatus Latescibacterota bacterium]HDI00021.1 M20 family peptidase [Bacillota bacterium]
MGPQKDGGEMREKVLKAIDEAEGRLKSLSMRIYENPELAWQEHRAVGWICEELEGEGFQVERSFCGMDTAFRARLRGRAEGPVVALLAEYDALPGLGHACGHHLIAGMAVGAALGLKEVLPELEGEVQVIGTPAEEGGGAKAKMVEEGAFDGVDVAMMMHPSGRTIPARGSLAVRSLEFVFHGRAAHAAADPEKGINALDAVVQTFNSINALRQQLPDDVRIHGIITDGGQAVNVIPERASMRLGVRTLRQEFLNELVEKVEMCARGAAMATGAKLEVRRLGPVYAAMKVNRPLARIIEGHFREFGLEIYEPPPTGGMGSTDMGNVSRVVPAAHPYISISHKDIPGHSEEFKEAGRSPLALERMLVGAKVLALTALDLLTDRELLEEVKRDFREG